MTHVKKYSKKFKLYPISLVLKQPYSGVEAAKSLDINPDVITLWINEHQQDDDGLAIRANGKFTREQEEMLE
jgi:transposase